MKHTHQFRHGNEETGTVSTTNVSLAEKTFETVEELLRHDARQTPLPATLAQRLTESLRKEKLPSPSQPVRKPSLLRRIFRRG